MVNLKSADQCILGNFSTGRVYAPNIFIRSSAMVLHCAMKCTGVSSSSRQRGHRASCLRPITLRCWLRLPCPVSSPIKILKCPLSSLKAYFCSTRLKITLLVYSLAVLSRVSSVLYQPSYIMSYVE